MLSNPHAYLFGINTEKQKVLQKYTAAKRWKGGLDVHTPGIRAFLPAATKLGQGNVFTGICDSVHGGWGWCSSVHTGIPPPRGDTPPADPPEQTPTLPEQTPPRTKYTPQD